MKLYCHLQVINTSHDNRQSKMADPESERAPLLRNTSEPSAPPAYSAYGDEGGIRKKTLKISVSIFNKLTAHI